MKISKSNLVVFGAFLALSCSSEPPSAPKTTIGGNYNNCNTQPAGYVPPVPVAAQNNTGVAPAGGAQQQGGVAPVAQQGGQQTFLAGDQQFGTEQQQAGSQQAQTGGVAPAPVNTNTNTGFSPADPCAATTWTPTGGSTSPNAVIGDTALDNTGATTNGNLLGAPVGLSDEKTKADSCIRDGGYFDRVKYKADPTNQIDNCALIGDREDVSIWTEKCDLLSVETYLQSKGFGEGSVKEPASYKVDQCLVCKAGSTFSACKYGDTEAGPTRDLLYVTFATSEKGIAPAPPKPFPLE